MKHLLAAGVALALLAGPVAAQTAVTTTTDTTGSITIAPEKRTVIKQRLGSTKPVTLKEKVSVGMTVPSDVELVTVPEAIYSDVPAIRNYRYFVYNDDVVLVDPSSRRVVQVIE
jgi:Protein of unknown function (DUF1236)